MSLHPSTCAMMQVPSSSFTVWSWTQPSPVHIPHIGVSYTEANQLEQTPIRSIESTALLTESAEKKSHSDHFFFFSCVQVPLHTWFQPITNEKRRQKKKGSEPKKCVNHMQTQTQTQSLSCFEMVLVLGVFVPYSETAYDRKVDARGRTSRTAVQSNQHQQSHFKNWLCVCWNEWPIDTWHEPFQSVAWSFINKVILRTDSVCAGMNGP